MRADLISGKQMIDEMFEDIRRDPSLVSFSPSLMKLLDARTRDDSLARPDL